MRRFFVICAAFACLAIVLSACGGDDAPETPIAVPTETAEPLDKAEFIREADARCREANDAIESIAEQGGGLTQASEIADLRNEVVDDIQALDAPDDDRATLNEFLTAFEEQVAAGRKIGLAVKRGDDTSTFEQELDAAQSTALTAGEAYGFQECGQEPSASGPAGTTDSGGTSGYTPAPAPVTPAPSTGGGTSGTGGDTGGNTGGGVTPGGTGGGIAP